MKVPLLWRQGIRRCLFLPLSFLIGGCQPLQFELTPAAAEVQTTLTPVSSGIPGTTGFLTNPATVVYLPSPLSTAFPTEPPVSSDSPIFYEFSGIHVFAGSNPLDESAGWAIAYGSDNQDHLLHTMDSGQTWTKKYSASHFYDAGTVFLNPQAVWISSDDQWVRTVNGGETWTPLDAPPGYFHRFADAENGGSLNIVVAAGNAYVTFNETHDGGKTWSLLSINPPWESGSPLKESIHLCNLCGDHVYYDSSRIMVIGGLLPDQTLDQSGRISTTISFNHGQTWKDAALVVPVSKTSSGRVKFVAPIFFDEKHGVFSVWIADQQDSWRQDYYALVPYYTEDGGLTWNPGVPAPSVLEGYYYSSVSFLSMDDALIRCGELLCVTSDGARSWRLVRPDINFQAPADYARANYLVDLSFVNSLTGFALLKIEEDKTQLYKTVDGGLHWILIDLQIR